MATVDFQQFSEVMALHELQVPAAQVQQLVRYCELLWEWNESINLTRHTTIEKFVSRDLIDSIQLAQLIAPGEKVLDVGSGGGVPGIILAILRPDLKVSLSESVGKKARVLEDLVTQLALQIKVYPIRAEYVLNDSSFDVLVARAVGPLWKICRWFEPHWQSIKRLLAVKGSQWVEERHEARQQGYLKQVQLRRAASYHSPATGANHVILKLWSKTLPETGPTPEGS
ncbi:MAG: 16S rRNA (guanine(527)-N(7))-methyltransferase RsmG [Pirellulaceae bacterium]|nr:16S rRNA (guanine(527)-N(7))-methyltransferase RsmG [Pirellulaceae bacterium]